MEGVQVGRIVHYVLGANDIEAINRRRMYTTPKEISARIEAGNWPIGAQAHVGNHAEVADHCAMMIVKVWPDGSINGQVFLDGNDVLWVTSVEYHQPDGITKGRTWHWPERS